MIPGAGARTSVVGDPVTIASVYEPERAHENGVRGALGQMSSTHRSGVGGVERT